MNTEAPDPHAAYRHEVEAAEDMAAALAMVTHHRQRSYAHHLEVRARDQRIAELEAKVAVAERKVIELVATMESRDTDAGDDATA